MASRNNRSGRGNHDQIDSQPLHEDNNSGSKRSGCPQTWKVAVSLLLVCALFLTGIVIGYLVARTGRHFQPDIHRCDNQGRNNGKAHLDSSSTVQIGDDYGSYDDPRELIQRHWNFVEYLASMDHRLPSELV